MIVLLCICFSIQSLYATHLIANKRDVYKNQISKVIDDVLFTDCYISCKRNVLCTDVVFKEKDLHGTCYFIDSKKEATGLMTTAQIYTRPGNPSS